ncbi:hypothetical protein HT105_24940, partial [Bacteroides fragilis]|nr:hypothetical protein [Bacteroides fragilis]
DEEIRELLEKTDESGSVEQTVSDWISQSNAGTVMDTGGDSNSSGGSDLTSGDEEIRELLEKTDESGSVEQTVSDWISQSNAGTV